VSSSSGRGCCINLCNEDKIVSLVIIKIDY